MQKHSAGMNSKNLFSASFWACIVLLAFVSATIAAPHDGDEFELEQPDGSTVPVIVWGDEFYQTVECPEGFTLVRDASGWITYAALSADGSEFVSTGVRYMGPQSTAPFFTERGLRIDRESRDRKARQRKNELGVRDEDNIPRDNRRNRNDGTMAPAPAPDDDDEEFRSLAGSVLGLAVLIDFPNQTSNITHAAMTDFFNRVGGVNGNTASGSVRDWFFDASGGTLDYQNRVTRFFRAANPKNNYDTGTGYGNVRVLLGEIFAQLREDVERGTGPNSEILCGISTESGSGTASSPAVIRATNVYYAGSPAAGWANGLWPHQGTYSGNNRDITIPANRCGPNTAARTVRISRYQLTSLGTGSNPPSIGTTVHENGHMIMRWPDFYNYDSENGNRNVVGSYCVMSSSNGGNPQQPNPHLRNLAGWIDVIDITNANQVYTQELNVAQTAGNPRISMSRTAYYFQRNNNEGYFIEGNRRVGRSSNKPGEGLVIWHLHRSGQNTYANRPNTANPHPLLKVIQSNQPTNTESAFSQAIGTNANAPFNGTRNVFHSESSPRARYYDGTLSAMRITEISNINTSAGTISFRVGTGSGTTPTTYTITFNPQGGTVTPTTATTGTNGRLTTLPAPARAGFTFDGWFTAATGGTAVTAGAEGTVFTANTTIHARWTEIPPATFTITFDPRSGTVTPTSAVTGANGRLAALPTPTRADFTFDGWFTARTGGERVTAGAAGTVFTANTTIFAQWTAIPTYTITFNPNGGSVTPTSAVTGTNGRLAALPAPTRADFTFDGWFTARTGGTEVTTATVFTAAATIFARWTAMPTYTITFNPQSGTVTPTTAVTGTNGRLASLPAPTRTDYEFDGWFTEAEAGTEVTTATVFTVNTTIFAQWTALPTYTITFDPQRGSVAPTGAVTGTNGMLAALPTPIRANFTFDGWFTEEAAGTEVTTATVFDADATIFAQWTAFPIYAVTYDANGGNGTMDASSVIQGHSYTVKANAFTRAGYEFTGWNTVADGSGTDYDAGAQISDVTADVTLYAVWDFIIAVKSQDRIIPGPQQNNQIVITTPVTVLASEFTAGPNPVAKSAESVTFFRQGRRIQDASLTIYDVSGNVINKVKITDKALSSSERRPVGSWNLTDRRGRKVSEGTYLVRGFVTDADGNRERISMVFGVR
ncbi:MAG: InlB B-repeat-containing protein [Chitinispirillia bacterium]|nr:InlB B-repeat-containing protein [Chitinispirillia bacterium]